MQSVEGPKEHFESLLQDPSHGSGGYRRDRSSKFRAYSCATGLRVRLLDMRHHASRLPYEDILRPNDEETDHYRLCLHIHIGYPWHRWNSLGAVDRLLYITEA